MASFSHRLARLPAAATLAAAMLVAADPAEASPFSGPYVGVGAGYERYSRELDGATYHVVAGGDIRVRGSFVIGAEVRLGDSAAKAVERRETATFTEAATTKIDRQIGGQIRVGHLLGDQVLLFAAGGLERFTVDAQTKRTPKAPCTNCNPTVTDFSFKETLWTLGGGVEFALNDNLRLRTAYTYANGEAFDRHALALTVAVGF